MERLAPIIKQKFWILLGVGIVMTFTGWWLATGTLAATVKTRVEKVNSAFGKVPSGEIPNNDWSTKLAARNTEQERAVRNTALQLWERQVSRMTWPSNIAAFTRNLSYRGEIPLAARENYRLDYGFDVRRVWESVHPFIQADGSGIVVFGTGPQVLPQKRWGALAPTSAEMWDAQEDLWLLESLLQSIVDVNGGPDAQRSDASIHAIEKLELFGGVPAVQRKTTSTSSSAGPGGGGGPGGGHGMGGAASMMSGPGGGFGGAEGNRAGAQALASADFDRREEFGDDGSSKGGGMGGPGGGGFGGGSPGGAHGGPASGPGLTGPGGGGATSAAAAVKRYIEDDKALPYKTRGFYMTLIMDHRKIPSLIAELSASEKSAWPAEVVRVQMVRLHDDDIGGGTGGSFGGAPGPGMLGGSGGGAGGRFSLSSILSGNGSSGPGFGASGPSFDGEFTGAPTSTFPTSSGTNPYGPGAGGAPGTATVSPAAAGLAALESALQDPFMARVAIAGYITLYNEVKPDPVVTNPSNPTPGAPAAGNAPPAATPAVTSEDPAMTPEASKEGTPAEGEMPAEATPAETDPAKPTDPAATPTEAKPDESTPPAKTETSPETTKSP
ncbi:MAG: hypothetical protein E6Q76_04665 [Rhizobium sp.]|nr:MAG: hypothetical protein E6Q76_04665 [Rhizobium sp.]